MLIEERARWNGSRHPENFPASLSSHPHQTLCSQKPVATDSRRRKEVRDRQVGVSSRFVFEVGPLFRTAGQAGGVSPFAGETLLLWRRLMANLKRKRVRGKRGEGAARSTPAKGVAENEGEGRHVSGIRR